MRLVLRAASLVAVAALLGLIAPPASAQTSPTPGRLANISARAYTGSGWLVPLLGDMQTMPGLGVKPAAFDVDIDENGRTVGLF